MQNRCLWAGNWSAKSGHMFIYSFRESRDSWRNEQSYRHEPIIGKTGVSKSGIWAASLATYLYAISLLQACPQHCYRHDTIRVSLYMETEKQVTSFKKSEILSLCDGGISQRMKTNRWSWRALRNEFVSIDEWDIVGERALNCNVTSKITPKRV